MQGEDSTAVVDSSPRTRTGDIRWCRERDQQL